MLRLPAGTQPGLITAEYDGDATFVITGHDDQGTLTGDLLFNTIGKTRGTVAYNLTSYQASTRQLDVRADSEWKVTLGKLEDAPAFGSSESGTGSTVFSWGGKRSDIAVRFKPGSSFGSIAVIGVSDDGPDRLVDEWKAYQGTATVQDGTSYLVVEASAPWTITKKK